MNIGAIPIFQGRENILKRGNIILHHQNNIFCIGHTDLFPHFRRRGGDTGNILKASGSQPLHQRLGIVRIPNQIDQAGSNQMRKVADSRHNPIVLSVIQHNGDGIRELCYLNHPVNVFLPGKGRRCDNIIGIFQKVIGRIFIAGLF